jgi:hypothetical protein
MVAGIAAELVVLAALSLQEHMSYAYGCFV